MRKRSLRRGAGLGMVAVGILLGAFAFPGLASAHTPSATGSPTCTEPKDGSWIAHFVVHNDPDANYGAATISGTGTSLDGQSVTAAGTVSLDLNEASNVSTVTLSGALYWPKDKYSAPFTHTETKPADCTPVDHTTTATATVTETQTVPGPTVTVPGPTQTETVIVSQTATVTHSATVTETSTIPGPTTTVIVPGPTVTLTETHTATETQTNTATATETQTQTATETQTATVTETPPPATVTEIQTVTATQTVPGCTVESASEGGPPACPTATVTEVVTAPGATTTLTDKSTVVRTVTFTATAVKTNTVTVTKYNCPPGTSVQGGSLAYTGAGDNATLAMIAGALLAGGMAMTFAGRRRRAH